MSYVYSKAKQATMEGLVDWVDDDIRMALIDTGNYTASQDADDFLDDITGGTTGVVGTPVALTNQAVSISSGKLRFDFDNVTFSSVTGNTVEAVVLFVHTGTDSTARLLAYIDDFGAGAGSTTITPNGGDIVIQLGAYCFQW